LSCKPDRRCLATRRFSQSVDRKPVEPVSGLAAVPKLFRRPFGWPSINVVLSIGPTKQRRRQAARAHNLMIDVSKLLVVNYLGG
jgi:hypothetical protein